MAGVARRRGRRFLSSSRADRGASRRDPPLAPTADAAGSPAAASDPFVRRAGTALLPDGARLTWTAADGRRGRRWRSITVSPEDRLLLALLLEVDADGRPAKLELASSAGLLTLHPEADAEALQGNVAAPDGVRHLSLAWSPAHVLVVAGSPIATAVAARRLDATVPVGEGRSVPAVAVDARLDVRPVTLRVARPNPRRWRLVVADTGEGVDIELDEDGVPAALSSGESWPLEIAEAAWSHGSA